MRLVKYFSYSSLVSFVQYGYVFDPTYPRGCRAPVPHAPSSATIALQFPGEHELTHNSYLAIQESNHNSWGIQSQYVSHQVLEDSLKNPFLFKWYCNIFHWSLSYNASHIPLHVSLTILHTVAPPTLKLKDCDSCESPVARYLIVITSPCASNI